MNLSREQRLAILQRAANDLMAQNPFICTVQQGCLIVQWNWKDTTYFNGQGVAREACSYRHIVKIKPDGKFITVDLHVNNYQSIGLDGMRLSQRIFSGKSVEFHKEVSFGVNNQTGQKGFVVNQFDSRIIQEPVKRYFRGLGLEYKFFSLSDSFHAVPPVSRILLGFLLSPMCVAATVAFAYVACEGLSKGPEESIIWLMGTPVFALAAAVTIYCVISGFIDHKKEQNGDWLD